MVRQFMKIYMHRPIKILKFLTPGGFKKMFEDTQRENTPSNKTEVLTKSMNMYISATDTLNELLLRGSFTQI